MRDLRAEIAELDEQILLCESFEEFEEMRVLVDRRIRLKAAQLEEWVNENGTEESKPMACSHDNVMIYDTNPSYTHCTDCNIRINPPEESK